MTGSLGRAMRLARLVLVAVALGGVLAVAPQPSFATEPRAVVEDVTVALRPITESTGGRLVGGESRVEPFTMIGATYTASRPQAGRIRARVDGRWSRWFPITELETGAEHGPDPGTEEAAHARPASDPIWFGDATGFQLSLPADARGVEVHLVRETTARVVVDATEDADGYTIPPVRSRSAWGAAPYRGRVETTDGLQRAIVHHTVNGNGYSRSQVPALLRSIQAYHQNTNGWDDIGYNFVIDRFGTVWEGRAQSLYEPVIGAHAQGHNTGSVGVAFLGDTTSVSPSATVISNLGRFLGWKMSLHGARPTRSNIVGHRDVGQTACPGNRLYGQLGAVRNRAIATTPPAGPFFDVPNSHPLATPLRWARNADVVDPLPNGNFRPGGDATRAALVEWLWRLAGRPPGGPQPFTDVPNNASWREAVRWAYNAGIVTDPGDHRFRPGATMTREQWVIWLWRYAGSPVVATHHGYTDVPDGVGSEAALNWSDDVDLVPPPTFDRSHRMKRGESVKLLWILRDL